MSSTANDVAAEDRPFSTAQCDALFAAVLIDDEIDGDLKPPELVTLDYQHEQLSACFLMCRQLWVEGFDRALLIALSNKLLSGHQLDQQEKLGFKHVRAKFKHFRYAHALYGVTNRYPIMLDQFTITMGKVQDAYRNDQNIGVVWRASLLRALLTKPLAQWLYVEGERPVAADPATFRELLNADYAKLADVLTRRTMSGHEFHSARKIVGRQVSFWDTLRTLEPSEERYRMSRWLSAINGSMGLLHDLMIERRAVDRKSYGADFILPDDIRDRIDLLVRIAWPRRND